MARGTRGSMLLLTLVLTVIRQSVCEDHERDVEEEQQTLLLRKKLFENYDSSIRPYFGTNRPVEVNISIGIVSFESVSETTLDFTINTYLVQEWMDPRLKYNATFKLPPTSSLNDKVWLPDLIFFNAKFATLHDVTLENRVVQIQPDGEVCLYQRLRLVLACAMNFTYFPLDQQICPIEMQSFEYTTDDLIFRFYENVGIFSFQGNLQLPQFIILGATLSDCTRNLTIGNISCITAKIFFQREFRYYLFHVFLPSVMLVVLSWVSFVIDVTSVAARVSLCVTTILTMLTSTIGSQKDLPKVAYLKAIDVWFQVNLLFVIAALLEYAVIHHIGIKMPSARYYQEARKHEDELRAGKVTAEDGESRKVASPAGSPGLQSIRCLQLKVDKTIADGPAFRNALDHRYQAVSLAIDRCCRVIFPMVYFLFLLLFFVVSTPESEEPIISQKDLKDSLNM